MIVTARSYLEDVLKTIGISKVFSKLADIEGAMKPTLWAVLENPEPEEYTPNYTKQLYIDQDGRRQYHIKDYDATAVLTVRIGATKDEIAAKYKREFLRILKRYIPDADNYRLEIVPLSADLNPADDELPNTPHVLLRIRFTGGLWRRTDTPLIQAVTPDGEIVRNSKKLEE